MKPKKEAKELVDSFKQYSSGNVGGDSEKYTSKQCALICVKDKVKFIMELQVSDLMKYDLVEHQIIIQREIEKL
tara:strand:+ start:375 stop:596 length:222 start_codon:yes stop_codon:yes gene_type:complete